MDAFRLDVRGPAPAGVGGMFDYPTDSEAGPFGELTFLDDRSPEDWEFVLEHTETLRFSPGETVIRSGDQERALYLVTAGRLGLYSAARPPRHLRSIEAPSIIGEVAFLDGGTRSVSVVGETAGELRRLSLRSFEALSARRPELGRAILLDLGRIVARRLRQALALMDDHVS